MIPTCSISGDVQTGNGNNTLFADMEFNDAELVLLEPFLGGLVSDLKGQLSGRVLVQGSLEEPVINDVSYLEFKNARSEEHTSELQSLMRISYAVFCLKKKKIRQQ